MKWGGSNPCGGLWECEEQERGGQEYGGLQGSRQDDCTSGCYSSSLVLLQTLRSLTPAIMEGLLSHLSGGTLLVAGLSYGLGVRIEALRHVRLRDVHSGGRSLDIDGRRYTVPAILADDLRDFIQERVCGFEASISVYRREQALFGGEVFDLLRRHIATRASQGGFDWLHPDCAEMFGGGVSERFISLCIAFLSRSHSKRVPIVTEIGKRAGTKGARLPPAAKLTPLDLLDKGPRIVRRARSGAITAYYLWRVSTEYYATESSSLRRGLESR